MREREWIRIDSGGGSVSVDNIFIAFTWNNQSWKVDTCF